jgi:glyoxylase-like metal-dependent hydrolase (beta-lactamase superfamily II)
MRRYGLKPHVGLRWKLVVLVATSIIGASIILAFPDSFDPVLGAASASAETMPTVASGSLKSPEAERAAVIFRAYINARNRHDFQRVNDLRVKNSVWFDAQGNGHPGDEARLRAMLAWESVMSAKWGCRILGYTNGWLEAEAWEENRMYDALGVGTAFQRDRIRIAGERILELRAVSEWVTGRNEDEAFAEFKDWLQRQPAQRQDGLLRDGNLLYDADSATRELPLLDEFERDYKPAQKILAATVDALVGAERLSKLDGWFVEGKGRENLSAELQGLAPDTPTWRPHEEKVAVLRALGAVAWERRTPRNDQSLRWRRFIYKPDSFGVVDWAGALGAMTPNPTSTAAREALMRRVPHILLLDVLTHAKSLKTQEDRLLDGVPHDVVQASLPDDTPLSLIISRNPRVLARIEYPLYIPGLGDVFIRWKWHGWAKSATLGFAPSGHAIDVNGTPFQEVEYSRYESGAAAAADQMKVPSNLPALSQTDRSPVPPAGPATGEVAPGVHVAAIQDFMGMWVEFRDFVVVFDAEAAAPGLESIPASGRSVTELVTEGLLAAIARTCPGKPVRYVIVSHHHSDHVGGIRGFAKPDLTILAAPSHVATVRRALTAAHTLAPDTWKNAVAEVTIEAVPSRRLITDGVRRLEVINVGENPHTAENLFAWLPDERILLQGDLFYYEEGAPFPPSGRSTMNRFFANWLSSHGFSPRAIYGVHDSGAAGPEALARARR